MSRASIALLTLRTISKCTGNSIPLVIWNSLYIFQNHVIKRGKVTQHWKMFIVFIDLLLHEE
jgi:hypothetical protein